MQTPRRVLPSLVLTTLVCGVGVALGARSSHPSTPVLLCPSFVQSRTSGHYLSRADFGPAATPAVRVDGNNFTALVDRSPRFRLEPNYAPADLVDVRNMHPTPTWACVPPDHQCLRREAADAIRRMFTAMEHDQVGPWIDSAFRSYPIQCMVFDKWAYHEGHGFCNATVFSAIPGHSQHQLGTAIDLFTRAWVHDGARFRDGFGCSPGGRWLASHAWEQGFVIPYPLHPDHRVAGSDCLVRPAFVGRQDPRTGYKYEPWHLRYIGVQPARDFHTAWLASGPGTATEITLEQWLRSERAETDLVEPPLCDGCNCGNCATFDTGNNAPCSGHSLTLDASGHPVVPTADPSITAVTVSRVDASKITVVAEVNVPANVLTQPPIVGNALPAPDDWEVGFSSTETITSMHVVPQGVVHGFPALPGAWRLAIGRVDDAALPWQAALVEPTRDRIMNGVNARIPAGTGVLKLTVPLEGVATGVMIRVMLVKDGTQVGEQRMPVP